MTTLDDLSRYDNEEDEFKDDQDTKSILKNIDAVIGKRTAQNSYDWLCDLENKIQDRLEVLAANPEVKG